jgi:hypothetical protein
LINGQNLKTEYVPIIAVTEMHLNTYGIQIAGTMPGQDFTKTFSGIMHLVIS